MTIPTTCPASCKVPTMHHSMVSGETVETSHKRFKTEDASYCMRSGKIFSLDLRPIFSPPKHYADQHPTLMR
jgi:hypothetical protein